MGEKATRGRCSWLAGKTILVGLAVVGVAALAAYVGGAGLLGP